MDVCIDCDGIGSYPNGQKCKSCGGSGLVATGDGIKPTTKH
jgi:DnaJ-class molecular chaperone